MYKIIAATVEVSRKERKKLRKWVTFDGKAEVTEIKAFEKLEEAKKAFKKFKTDVTELTYAGASYYSVIEYMLINEMDDDFLAAKKILSDVPARSLKPAENYVASMVQGERPADTLASLTPVEGVNQVEFTPAESMGILDIHDSKNEPIVADLEDGLDPEQKQNLAADYMNAAINSLPDDRKAIVSELKNAVENWANANGQDPKAAFAEKLRDLAAGWDDESLNAVAQTYVDADREIAASTAG